MPFTEAPGFKMFYEVHGTEGAAPLLLIPGIGSDSVEWADVLPGLSERFRVITFDQRGSGESETTEDDVYSAGMLSDDAAALLHDLGIAKAHILGVSMGGMVAQELALLYPDFVDRLVLCCTSPGGEGAIRASDDAIARFLHRAGRSREESLRRAAEVLWGEPFRREHPEVVDAWVARRLERPFSETGYARQLAVPVGHDAWDRLPEIVAPTLVITGDADTLVPPENAERIASRIPNARVVVLPGVGHKITAEVPELFVRTVTDFLTG